MLLPQKEIEAYFAAALLAFASLCSARPNQNEMLVKSSAALAQDSSAKVPEEKGKWKGGMPEWDEAATVQEVEPDRFRRHQIQEGSSAKSGVKRRVRRLERIYQSPSSQSSVWSSLTDVIEYSPFPRRKRSDINEEEGYYSRTLPIKKKRGEVSHIVRIKVRKGGVAIAGPGGVASAGTGGTAIVGPGGSAYTETDGTAVVGPGAKLYIPETRSAKGARSGPVGYRLIATGPFVFQPQVKPVEPQAFF